MNQSCLNCSLAIACALAMTVRRCSRLCRSPPYGHNRQFYVQASEDIGQSRDDGNLYQQGRHTSFGCCKRR